MVQPLLRRNPVDRRAAGAVQVVDRPALFVADDLGVLPRHVGRIDRQVAHHAPADEHALLLELAADGAPRELVNQPESVVDHGAHQWPCSSSGPLSLRERVRVRGNRVQACS